MAPRTPALLITILILVITRQVTCKLLTKYFLSLEDNKDIYCPCSLLSEQSVDHKLRCLSMCKHECNQVLYNSTTGMCRLYRYDHFKITQGNTIEEDWQYYAESCEEPLGRSTCNIIPVMTPPCSSCRTQEKWAVADVRPCKVLEDSEENMPPGDSAWILSFNLTFNMIVSAQVSRRDGTKSEVALIEAYDSNVVTFVGVEVSWEFEKVTSFNKEDLMNVKPNELPNDPNNYVVEIHIMGSGTTTFLDGVPLHTFNRTYTGLNHVSFTDQKDIIKFQIIKLPDSCI